MESFPLFFRIRAITFSEFGPAHIFFASLDSFIAIIMLFSFLWLVLLSVEIYARWTMTDQITRAYRPFFTASQA